MRTAPEPIKNRGYLGGVWAVEDAVAEDREVVGVAPEAVAVRKAMPKMEE